MIHKPISLKRARTQKIYLNPFAYLLREKGRKVAPKVIAGDVECAKALIRNSPFEQRYTSIVLSFSESIGEDTIFEIIKSYERCAFVGIDESKIVRVWVLHSEHDRTELHCVIVNSYHRDRKADLRWQHAYVNVDRDLYKSWQELVNLKYGFLSPDDPAAARLRSYPYSPLTDHDREIFEEVDREICRRIESGAISNRDDIINSLEELGYQTNPKQTKIGIRNSSTGRYYIYLEGRKYDECYDVNAASSDIDFANTEARRAYFQEIFKIELRQRQIRMALKYGDEAPLPPIKKVSRGDLHKLIDRDLDQLIQTGEVSSRRELIDYLKAKGHTISREAKGSISIRSPLIGKGAMRLTGKKFTRDYDFKPTLTKESSTNTRAEKISIITKERQNYERIDTRVGKANRTDPEQTQPAIIRSGRQDADGNRPDGTTKRYPAGRTVQDTFSRLRGAIRQRRIEKRKNSNHSDNPKRKILEFGSIITEPFWVGRELILSLLSDFKRRKDRENQIRRQRDNVQKAIGELDRSDPKR